MTRPSLVRSFPYWVLVIGSIASAGAGAWIVVSKLGTMIAGLDASTATTADVYGGQSWIVFGAALFGAGLVGLVAVFALAVLRSFVPARPVEVAEPIDWHTTDAGADDESPADADLAAVSAEDDDETAAQPADETAEAIAVKG